MAGKLLHDLFGEKTLPMQQACERITDESARRIHQGW